MLTFRILILVGLKKKLSLDTVKVKSFVTHLTLEAKAVNIGGSGSCGVCQETEYDVCGPYTAGGDCTFDPQFDCIDTRRIPCDVRLSEGPCGTEEVIGY